MRLVLIMTLTFVLKLRHLQGCPQYTRLAQEDVLQQNYSEQMDVGAYPDNILNMLMTGRDVQFNVERDT